MANARVPVSRLWSNNARQIRQRLYPDSSGDLGHLKERKIERLADAQTRDDPDVSETDWPRFAGSTDGQERKRPKGGWIRFPGPEPTAEQSKRGQASFERGIRRSAMDRSDATPHQPTEQ